MRHSYLNIYPRCYFMIKVDDDWHPWSGIFTTGDVDKVEQHIRNNFPYAGETYGIFMKHSRHEKWKLEREVTIDS